MLGICLSVTDRHIWSKYFLHILLFVNNCSQLKYLAIGKLFWKSTWSLLYDNRICACNQYKSYMTCILLCYKEIIVYNDVKIIMIPEQGVHLENKNRLNDNRNLLLSLGMICLHDQLITSLKAFVTNNKSVQKLDTEQLFAWPLSTGKIIQRTLKIFRIIKIKIMT